MLPRCARCGFPYTPVLPCICDAIAPVATRTRVVIVRHHSEQGRSSNTGRLAHLALPNSVIVDHGSHQPGQPPTELGDLAGAWLLFPEGEPRTEAPEPPPRQLVVLDATWAQARRMYRKLPALRGLPMLRLPDQPMPVERLRASPGPGRVSTIEAIARALRLLEGDGAAAPLEHLFARAVAAAAALG